MARDDSPGDARKPYSDIGGPAARHAQTHDVRREELTNPKGPEPEDTSFAEQMEPETTGGPGGHVDESVAASEDKELHRQLTGFTSDELARLSVLNPGTQLEQGSSYLDLIDRTSGPFTAMAGDSARPQQRLIAKRDTDYELWGRLVESESTEQSA